PRRPGAPAGPPGAPGDRQRGRLRPRHDDRGRAVPWCRRRPPAPPRRPRCGARRPPRGPAVSGPDGPGFAPVPLEEVLRTAELQTRVDRKYLVPHRAFAEFERGLAAQGEWAELEIDGRRGFAYASVYFDTPDLLGYRQHVQGRRRRFKARTRGYLDSGTASFEVKMEGARSATVKERTAHPVDRLDEFTPEARDFLAAVLHREYGIEPPRDLRPAAVTSYRRRTLVRRSGGARLTLDEGLVFRIGTDTVPVPPGWVLAESKSPGGDTPAD